MKPILVPTDFSKCANNAMMYALEVASRTGQPITVLYVVYPNEGIDNNMYDAFFVDNYVQQRLEGMEKWVKKFTRSEHVQHVPVKLECRIGFPVSTITQTATDLGASMIIMGTTGASGLRGVLLGSIAGGVISASKLPVIVVPQKAVFRNNARFALATDFRFAPGKESLKILRDMLNIQHTGLNVVHVMTDPNQKPDLRHQHALTEKLDTIPHDFHYLHDKNIVRAIHNFLESTNCNGLVAVAHDHSLLHTLFAKSISRSLAHHTSVPILVLHDH
ncbi:MAG TPA: universal stress protein [Saprospiraceae bacterium]|nr:universal stress protein [Saprospiraceae bacterium]